LDVVLFNELAGLLLTHEQRIQKHALASASIPSSVSIPASLTSSQAIPQANLAASTLNFELSAFSCTSFKHFWLPKVVLGAPNHYTGSFNNAEIVDKPICQLCSNKGHTADRCYKRFDSTYKPPPRPPFLYRPPAPQALLVQLSFAPPDTWYLDSGGSAHVTPDLNCFTSYTRYEGTEQLRVGDGSGLEISHTVSCYLGTNSQPLVLTNVLHVPTISKPLLSISKLVSDNDVVVEFNACSCFVKDWVSR
jgi:hypothetical protein